MTDDAAKQPPAMSEYNPAFFKIKSAYDPNVQPFRKHLSLINEDTGTSIDIHCTDSPGVFNSDHSQAVDAFRSKHPWTYSTLVCIIIKAVNRPSYRSANVFCMDIASFLNVFARYDLLRADVKKMAEGVTQAWNEVNGAAERATLRVGRDSLVALDHRRLLWTKGQEQTLQLILNAHNFTKTHQNDNVDLEMPVEEVDCSLRYRSGVVFTDRLTALSFCRMRRGSASSVAEPRIRPQANT
jgi:hypothetical protein